MEQCETKIDTAKVAARLIKFDWDAAKKTWVEKPCDVAKEWKEHFEEIIERSEK